MTWCVYGMELGKAVRCIGAACVMWAVAHLDPVRVRVPIFVEGAWRATCKHAVVAKPKVVAQTASVDTKYASSDLAALRIHVADVDCACQQRRVEP